MVTRAVSPARSARRTIECGGSDAAGTKLTPTDDAVISSRGWMSCRATTAVTWRVAEFPAANAMPTTNTATKAKIAMPAPITKISVRLDLLARFGEYGACATAKRALQAGRRRLVHTIVES